MAEARAIAKVVGNNTNQLNLCHVSADLVRKRDDVNQRIGLIEQINPEIQ